MGLGFGEAGLGAFENAAGGAGGFGGRVTPFSIMPVWRSLVTVFLL